MTQRIFCAAAAALVALAGSLSAGEQFTLSGQNKTLNCTLVNNGAATWTNGQVAMNAATFSNAASAVLNVLGDGSVFAQNSGTPLVSNPWNPVMVVSVMTIPAEFTAKSSPLCISPGSPSISM